MITKNEINTLSLSPTKKDFVQIWNELIEVAGKLSERWDPTSTNESDPGIVILKALTGIADKLNYNIDKNTLEAFMPTAAQEDSMRKLCDMLGYNIKYNQSAQTEATIKYHNSDPSKEEADALALGLTIPKFTVLTNSDQDISYFTTNPTPVYISSTTPSVTIPCMEGQLVKCESASDNNVITSNQISENNRFYLPETQIAENGIFIYNIFSGNALENNVLEDGTPWEKVDNLNIQVRGSRVFKFGFDSYEGRPYVEFPADYSELFNEGIFIYYTRTNGINGNISARTLTQLELPRSTGWENVSAESFSVENVFSATTGSNIETIKQAYNNFKKTIGTFETLVTCRDYMNKIYLMTNDYNKPLVSNILVTDIRNDLNRAITICSCDDAGIYYKETPLILGTKDVEFIHGETKTTEDYSSYEQLSDPQYTDYEQVGQPTYTEYEQVGEAKYSAYEQVGNTEYSEYTQVGSPTYTEYEQVGEAKYSEPKQVGEPEYSELAQISENEEEIYTINEATKPFYTANSNAASQEYIITGFNPQTGTATGSWVSRYTKWFIGTTANPIPLFSDEYKSSIVDDDNKELFDSNSDGVVHAYLDDGTRSEYWIIEQNGTLFTTKLPVNWIRSTTTTIVNQQTKTVTNQVTETIEKQRTETVKEQRTATVKEQRTETIEKQRTETIKEQRTETIEKQRTKTITNTTTDTKVIDEERAIDYFDLVFYPFKSYNQIKNNVKNIRDVYDASFTYSPSGITEIQRRLDDDDSVKTIAHNIKTPRYEYRDIISINNYYRLNATIATNSKITVDEGTIIIDNIKIALANAFNMRELDFGEEIPFDSIVEVIENADSRIRVASLNEPALYTTFSVFEGMTNGVPTIKEYAVESDWLTVANAATADRFDVELDKNGNQLVDSNGNLVGRFNTTEAKKIYNKLAVRNILAGRVPLFKYNTTFTTEFSEGAYQVTEEMTSKPAGLAIPSEIEPFTIWFDNNITYTGQYNTDTKEIKYTKTYVPEEYDGNLITDLTAPSGNKNVITDISTDLKINADETGTISNVTLAAGEYVQFRAPNFTTLKTYPAYVNYHLALDKETLAEANSASATSLFDLLKQDLNEWQAEGDKVRWQKVLDHFTNIDTQKQTFYKKTFTLSQRVSAFTQAAATSADLCTSEDNIYGQHIMDTATNKCKYCGVDMLNTVQTGPIVIELDNSIATTNKESAESLLVKSGCVKLINENFKARLTWDPADGEIAPSSSGPDLDFELKMSNPYITDLSVLNAIQSAITERLEELKGKVIDEGTPVLPTVCSWTISFDFECVPFEAESLAEWESFIKSKGYDLFGFTPIEENGTALWRIYDGGGYQIGKYILKDLTKLMKFTSSYFGLLPETRLRGIYIVDYLGKDAEPAVISNNEEYKLKQNEYLYIEYTPSSTTDEGTTQQLTSVTEIYGPGTIIRPSGFEAGLIDSSMYASQGNTPYKTVTFETANSTAVKIDMQRFGANEQVEIREFAKVELTKDSFKASPAIYYYKNFNGCDALEKLSVGKPRVNNVYTLKEGEYIFYTDQNKSELAYFSAGTQVTLSGNLVLDKQFDIIDLSTIFESGLQAIPWEYKALSGDDKIEFQEFQYITLGPDDTIKNITLIEQPESLSGQWQYCNNVVYSLAGSEETSEIAAVDVYADRLSNGKGNGWEVSSLLTLDVSSNSAQTLRKTDQIEASITLTSTSAGGINEDSTKKTITPTDEKHPLSFKTNLDCRASGANINIDDVYSNPNKLKGFELKVFSTDEPVIVKTTPNKVVPYINDGITDITSWPGERLTAKDYSELWTSVGLEHIQICKDVNYDSALRLPISILPNTYGIFCIYLNYTSDVALSNAKTWIEVIPGTTVDDISLLNVASPAITYLIDKDGNEDKTKLAKLYLKPGINCVRVNKTSKIFIKASEDAQGILYFDDIRLVDCLPVEYTDANGSHTLLTQGLNLDQIGYLNTDTTNAIDEDIRNDLKTEYAKNAYSDLDSLSRSVEKDFDLERVKLDDAKDKIKRLSLLTSSIYEELKKLSEAYPKNTDGTDNAYLVSLFERYHYINDVLTKEEALLKALNDNKNLDEIEQQLLAIIESFSVVEVSQQQLLDELETLKATVDTVIFKEATAYTDFVEAIKDGKTSLPDNILDEIKSACIDEINKVYNNKLAELSVDINNVINSEDRANLLSIFNNLSSEILTTKYTEITNKINSIIKLLDREAFNNLYESTYAAAIEADYTGLATELTKLSALVSSEKLDSLLSELELAANERNNNALTTLISELRQLFDTGAEPSDFETAIADLLVSVEAEISKVSDNTDSESGDSTAYEYEVNLDIVNAVKALRDSDINNYKDKLLSILGQIQTILLEKDSKLELYAGAINKLSESKDAQVTVIIEKLYDIENERAGYLNDVTKVTQIADYKNLPYSYEAISIVWVDYMKKYLVEEVTKLYEIIKTSINKLECETVISSSPFSRDVFDKAANIDAFLDLYTRVTTLVQQYGQNSANKDLVSEIGELVPVPSAMNDAMSNIVDESRNAKIMAIIKELQDDGLNIAKKQPLIKSLKNELQTAIQLDNKLFNIILSLISPSIATFDIAFKEELSDEFYAKIADEIDVTKASLATKDNTSIHQLLLNTISIFESYTSINDDLVNALCASSTDQLKTLVTGAWFNDFKNNSLLPETYNTVVNNIFDLVCLNEKVIDTKEAAFFNDLSSTSIEAWLKQNSASYVQILAIVNQLASAIKVLENIVEVPNNFKNAYNILSVEKQLLADIRNIDTRGEFYYNAPIEASLAIDFNESTSSLNSLMNPLAYYDINNINNSFVISKLDIDYLDSGIQIARSSRIR